MADVDADAIDPAVVEADFNGDTVMDRAMIAVRVSDESRGLIAVVGQKVHVLEADRVEAKDGLGPAEPGTWDTVCGNAFREFHVSACRSGYPAQIRLRHTGILWIGTGMTRLYFWDPKRKAFRSVTLVD